MCQPLPLSMEQHWAGGLELMIGYDFRVADEKHCSQFCLPEVKLGVLPGMLLG